MRVDQYVINVSYYEFPQHISEYAIYLAQKKIEVVPKGTYGMTQHSQWPEVVLKNIFHSLHSLVHCIGLTW